MFTSEENQKDYIREHLPDITDTRLSDELWDIECDTCAVVRGFHVTRKGYTDRSTGYSGNIDFDAPRVAYMKCPVCDGFRVLIYYRLYDENNEARYYRITQLPQQGVSEINSLPEEPKALRVAYLQAVKSMDAGAYIAAAAMYRRALQVITRDLGKVKPGNLASELKEMIGKTVNGVVFTEDFSQIGYVLKEAGNQAAHPDEDVNLLDFSQQDAKDLQKIFMSLVARLFIAPEAAKEAMERFMKSRKIK